MGDYQITCVNKPDRNSRHEQITHIGNGAWRLTLQAAIQMIDDGLHAFYTLDYAVTGLVPTLLDGATRAYIRVVRGQGLFGLAAFLQTERDGIRSNNLLALPECSRTVPVVLTLP